MIIDHICYRVATTEEYNIRKEELLKLGTLLIENPIGGRLISTFKLLNPIAFHDRNIYLIELPSPKKGSFYNSGLEHVEIVTTKKLEEFQLDYPDVTFNKKSFYKPVNRDLRFNSLFSNTNLSFRLDFEGNISVKFHEDTLENVINREIAEGLNN
ncbi:hypothetical protein HK099_000841 [Clydaea vesicula]|uniref:Uncharacterized protein n=1 Tax=Clydaea vesicula TaxID=447962 RepID=A0AAD5U8D1_9FUNG|nr:hypothetical protein HK099_000841 [Clydaea vesicula]